MSHDAPSILMLGVSGRPQVVLQELLQAAGLEVRTSPHADQALREQQSSRDPADLLLIDETVLDEVRTLLPRPFESAAPSWPSTVVLSSTLDAPVERVAPTFARLSKPVEPGRLLRELHIGAPAAEAMPRFDLWHGGVVLLVGSRLCEDAGWYKALEMAGLEAATSRSVPLACELLEQIHFDLVIAEARANEREDPCRALVRFRTSFGVPQPIAALLENEDGNLREELESLGVEMTLLRSAALEESLSTIGDYLHRLDRARG